MRAYESKQKYFACTKCDHEHPVENHLTWYSLDGETVEKARKNWHTSSIGVPDEHFQEFEEGGNAFVVAEVLVCTCCEYSVAKWNEYLDENIDTYVKQIKDFPYNGATIKPMYKCGNCESMYWEEEVAQDCCI